MHEVFKDIDGAKVGMINGLLNDSGIPTILKNFSGGSNITEIPIPALYPSIFVLDASKLSEARELINDYFSAKPELGEDWVCSRCGVTVDGFLNECWSCQAPKEIS